MQTLFQRENPRSMIVPADSQLIGIFSRSLQFKPIAVVAHKTVLLNTSALVHQCTVKTMQRFLGKPVHFSDTERVIPCLAEHPGHFEFIFPRHLPIAQHPVMPGRHSGEQGGACRRTAGSGAVSIVETYPLPGKRVQIRGFHRRVRHPDTISPLLVGHN